MLSLLSLSDSEPANDDVFFVRWQDWRKLKSKYDYSDFPVVSSDTYEDVGIHNIMYFRDSQINWADGIRPIIAKGAWFNVVSGFSSFSELRDHVLERYIKQNKITIVCKEDLDFVEDRFRFLSKRKIEKRGRYLRARTVKYYFNDFYCEPCEVLGGRGRVFVNGNERKLSPSSMKIVKALNKKLNNFAKLQKRIDKHNEKYGEEL